MRESEMGLMYVEVVERSDRDTLVSFVHRYTRSKTKVYTDEAPPYRSVRRPHGTVNHSGHRYVEGYATTNGIESFWAVLKRGYSTYHSWSRKHLHRYVREFVSRHNLRGLDVESRMEVVAMEAVGKGLRYRDLVG